MLCKLIDRDASFFIDFLIERGNILDFRPLPEQECVQVINRCVHHIREKGDITLLILQPILL